MKIQAYAAHQAGSKLQPFNYNVDALKSDEVEIDIEYCGICHSDSLVKEGLFPDIQYPRVPGHEVGWNHRHSRQQYHQMETRAESRCRLARRTMWALLIL